MTSEVRPLFAETQPGPAKEDLGPDFVAMARTISAICATRILLMIAVLTGAAIWAWTIYDPTHDRLMAAGAFSIVFMGPLTALYLKRG